MDELGTSRCDVRTLSGILLIREPPMPPDPKRTGMKALIVIMAVFILAFGTSASRAANLDRISAETGVPVAILQAERASTGLGWGSLENAHLLANATGQNFNDIVAQHQAGQGWGKIAHDNGLNLGTLVSNAHRSSQAATHAQNLSTVHGKSTMVHGRSAANVGRSHGGKVASTRGAGHHSSFRSGFSGFHGMRSMGHMSGPRGMGSIGHGGGRHR
jgi:hypothetical protein